MTEESLFFEALARPVEQRAAFLEAQCAGQPQLRLAVEALLAAHEKSGHPLDHPLTAPDQTVDSEPDLDQPLETEVGLSAPEGIPAAQTWPMDDVTPSQAGQIIAGRYTLIERIGEGGMGSVFRAEQREPVKRQVALKLIRAGMDSRTVLARFDAERQALALMDHPNIARIYDGGVTQNGQPFFVMELVQGVTLTEYCDSRKLSVAARLELFVAVCQAVQHAHQKGIIHRDLKPANVLVTEVDGRATPKVIDFGVAKATEQKLTDQSFVDTGVIVGTPAYMSPEQADPTIADIDTRTDVYALGVILYELLTGSAPIDARQFHRGAILEMLRMVREVDPPRPSTRVSTSDALPSIAATRGVEPAQLKRSLHGDLDWIVMKALEKERTRRYETANGLAADVMRHLAHEPVVAAPPSQAYRLRKFVRKNRGLVTAVGMVLLALVAGIAGTTWGLFEAKRQEQEAKYQEGLALDEAEKKELARADEERQRKRTDISLTDMLASRGLLAQEKDGQAEAALWFAAAADQAGVAGDQDRVEFNRVRVRNALGQAPVPLAALELKEYVLRADERKYGIRLDFQPGGELLLCRVGGERAFLWAWRDGRTLPWIETLTGMNAFCFSPDGTHLALGFASGDVQICRAADGQVVGYERLPNSISSLAYSPDGRLLAVGSDRVRLWDAESRTLLKPVAPHPEPITALKFNRTGQRLITVSGGMARVFAVDSGVPELRPLHNPIPHTLAAEPALTDADQTLVTVDQGLARWDLETGKLLARPSRAEIVGGQGVLSPNGDWVAVVKSDNNQHRVEAHLADERRPFVRLSHGHIISRVSVSLTGNMLLTSCHDGAARLWSMPDGKPIGQPLEHTGGWMLACALSADDRFIATVENEVVRIWQRPSPPPAQVVDAWGYRPRVSFDGQIVAPGCWHELANVQFDPVGRLQAVRSVDGKPAGASIPLDANLIDSCICADNRTVAAIWGASKIRVWDVATGKAVIDTITLPSEALSLAARPESTHVAVLCKQHLVVIDCQSGQVVLQVQADKVRDRHCCVRYTPDGKSIIFRDWNDVSVCDSDRGQLRFPPLASPEEISWFNFIVSPDSRWLATSLVPTQTVQVWDLTTGQAVSPPLPHPGGWGIFSLQFSSEGSRLLTAHKDGQVRYWDWKAGRLACPALVHPDEVYDAAVTPDGRFAVTAVRGRPWRTEVWELTTGKRVASPVHLPRDVGLGCAQLAITPDGRRILVTSQSAHLVVVDLEAILANPSTPTAEWEYQAELASNHRLDAGDLNRLSLDDWKRVWTGLPRRAPQRPWMELTAAAADAADVDERLIAYVGQSLQQRPGSVTALFLKWQILQDAGDKTRLIELCQQRLRNGSDEDAAQILLDLMPDPEWTVLNPIEMTAQKGTTLQPEPDGWILAAVKQPAIGTYRIRANSGLDRVTALRLEVSPHRSLPGQGSGSAGGNFHLTGVRAFRCQPGQARVPLIFASGDASHVRLSGGGPRVGVRPEFGARRQPQNTVGRVSQRWETELAAVVPARTGDSDCG